MSQIPSSKKYADAPPSSARRRYLMFGAIGFALALVAVVLPDLLRPEQAQAIDIPNPIEEVGDLAGKALGGAADAVSAPLKEGFVWMVNTLFGGPQADMTMALVKYLTTMPNFATGNVMVLQKNMQAVAGALLACVLTLSIVRYWLGSFFEGSNMVAGLEGAIKVIFAAIMIGLWPTLFKLAGHFFNALSATLLTDGLRDQLRELFTEISGSALLASGLAGPIGSSVGMLMWIVIAIATTILFLGLLLMKIMVTAGTVIVFVGMPLALILWPIPETSWIAKALAKTLVVLLAIPVVWVVIFSAAAALGSDVFGATDKEGAEVASTGLDAILIKPLIAIALMYMAITIPGKLLRMAPMMGAMRGGGRVSGMAMGIGTSMAARGAYTKMAGGAAGGAGGAGRNGASGASKTPTARTDAGKTPTATPAATPAAAVAIPQSRAAASTAAVDAAQGAATGAEAKRVAAAVNNTPSGTGASPAAWNSTAAETFGQGKYRLPGNSDPGAVEAKQQEAGQLKQQWAANNEAGKSPSSEEAQAAFRTLSPQAQSSVQAVAADSGSTGDHRGPMAAASVAENPYHGEEAKQAFATLGSSSPAIFQEAASSPPAPTNEGVAAATGLGGDSKPVASTQVFTQPAAPGGNGNGGGGNGGGPKVPDRPSVPAPDPQAKKVTPSTKQGG